MNFYIISPPLNNSNFTTENLEKVCDILSVNFFQFRPKHKLLKNRLKFVEKYYEEVSKLCKKKNIKLIINNDFEIAERFNFDGIHLGQNDKSCLDAKIKFGKKFIVGVSCSNSLQLYEYAKSQNADYVALGPMFKTSSKNKKEIDLLKLPVLIKKLRLPFTLIGGINHCNFKKLLKFKPYNLAMINSFWKYKKGPVKSALLFKNTIKEINNNEN